MSLTALERTTASAEERLRLAGAIADVGGPLDRAELPLLDSEEAAALLGVSIRTLRGYTPAQLPRVRVAKRGIRFRPRDLVAFARRRRQPREL